MPKPKNIPARPGVYFFRDKNGKVLYLGKATNLKARLKSYFDKSQDNPRPHAKRGLPVLSAKDASPHCGAGARLQKMLETAKSVDWQETGSEIEALILESQLIKKCRPPFNIMLRDDKQYFYIGFTNEQFPKIFITHQPPKKFTVYSDQFTENKKLPANQLKTEYWSLSTNSIGPFTDGTALRTTLKLLRRIFPYCTCKQKHNNYCLNYHLGNCFGICCLKIATRDKQQATKQKREYKKIIKAVKKVLSGKKLSVIKQFEKEMNNAAKNGDFEKAIELRDKIEKLKKVFENARIISQSKFYDTMIYHRKNGAGILAELKKSLRLPTLPRRIESYDISNIQGEFATGAMAVFTPSTNSGQANYRPDKNEYRKFKIRRRESLGDTGMLQEIITRRFNHPEWPYPDLILIDGGKAQLNAARSVIYGHRKSLGLAMSKHSIPIIALTKNEKHIGDHILSTVRRAPVKLKKLPPAVRNLILQIDAEAHRFAISYYRKLHKNIYKK